MVLMLSEKLEPSHLLGVGGLLFELFVLRKSNKKTYDTFNKLLKDKREKKSTILYFQEFKKEILTNFTLPFWFHVITTSPSINRNRNKPLAQLTLMLEFRGLSRLVSKFLLRAKLLVILQHTIAYEKIVSYSTTKKISGSSRKVWQ